jgi:UDP-N-acetylglucosamine 4-epimerase
LKKRILITGGAGFIGSNLCQAFLQKGLEVVCFDNYLTGKRSNIAGIFDHPNFKFIEGDIRDLEFVKDVMHGVHYVSHQAALGSVPRSIADPIPTHEINSQGFLNVLSAAKEASVERFVFASSSSVYGDSLASPKREDQLGRPLSPYAVSKLTNELYGEQFFKLYGFQTIGLRYFNVFGKNQDPNGVYAAAIPRFIQKIINLESPVIFGDGEQTRDFTHVSNVVEANLIAVLGENDHAFGQAYNVACGASYSLNFVVEIIKKVLINKGHDVGHISPVYQPKRQGDIRDSLADIHKIKSDLGFMVQTDFCEGMNRYIHSLILEKAFQ